MGLVAVLLTVDNIVVVWKNIIKHLWSYWLELCVSWSLNRRTFCRSGSSWCPRSSTRTSTRRTSTTVTRGSASTPSTTTVFWHRSRSVHDGWLCGLVIVEARNKSIVFQWECLLYTGQLLSMPRAVIGWVSWSSYSYSGRLCLLCWHPNSTVTNDYKWSRCQS